MVGDVYSGDRPQAWSTGGAFDRDLMPSTDAEEEMWLCHVIYCRNPGHRAVKWLLRSPCASSAEQKKQFIILFCFGGGGEGSRQQGERQAMSLSPAECRGDVRLPVHEAIHGRGHLPTSPRLLPSPSEQLL